ncbi:MAG: hypothetical protein JWO03_2882 [Bacteroidetes bacterium]|nr:hypothetical protein [Bacteroidota bacterium]
MFQSNNDIIHRLVPSFVAKVNASKKALGIHHDRTHDPLNTKASYKTRNGEIYRISLNLNKGEVMTHEGRGGRGQDSRTAKRFYIPNADEFLPALADAIAENTGDTICANLCRI